MDSKTCVMSKRVIASANFCFEAWNMDSKMCVMNKRVIVSASFCFEAWNMDYKMCVTSKRVIVLAITINLIRHLDFEALLLEYVIL